MEYLYFKLEKNNGGFFCQIWQLLCFYLISIKYKIPLVIDDTEWLFKNKDGWTDYFKKSEKIFYIRDIITDNIKLIKYVDDTIRHSFTILEYKNAILELLNPTLNILEKINNIMIKNNLIEGEFNSIFVRRGDKLYGESTITQVNAYIEIIKKLPNKKMFVQTDDFQFIKELKNNSYINNNNIEIISTCPINKLGAFVFNYTPEIGSNKNIETDLYIKSLCNYKQKCVKDYSLEEMKDHIEEMLCGIFICLRSENLISDFQSNTSRFIGVMFEKQVNLISVLNEESILFENMCMCPAHGFIYI